MARSPSAIALALLLAGCTVGPDYHRVHAPTPLTYKEAPPPGWSFAAPDDAAARGPWWETYADPTLTALEQRVALDNQTIKQFEANYRAAQALVIEARAGLFPTVGTTANASRARNAGFTANSGSIQATASWELDVWGRIRRGVEAARAGAEASAADLANAQLAAQASLATDYFGLCYAAAQQDLLRQTVAAYQRSLRITTNQANAGVAALSDVLTAQTQLDSAQSQLVAIGVTRAQYEHAIALLAGVPPTDLTPDAAPLAATAPATPISVASDLLQRRPDIAAAERAMQQQNANIGVAIAAYYPSISLSGAFGFSASPLSNLISASHELWSIGAAASQTLFAGGLRGAQVDYARANYDASVAVYRQTVLTAFQQVEDDLSTLRILADQAAIQAKAVADADRAVTIALNEYEAGTQNYTTVVTAQAILLNDKQTAIQIEFNRLTASVALRQAEGG